MKPTRQFWLGILVGLSLGSVLRRAATRGFSQDSIRRIYNVWAPLYQLANVYLLGQLPRMRRRAVKRLQLRPGDSVLEISCGTGANFPYLQEQIGPGGRLVGLDYTQAMLDEARRQVEERGWQNIELLHADAAELDLNEKFDGILWMLAASVVPGWQEALERAVAHLKPGGWLVIADARPFNWYATSWAWGPRPISAGAPGSTS